MLLENNLRNLFLREGKLLQLLLFLQVYAPACDVERFRADEKKHSVCNKRNKKK